MSKREEKIIKIANDIQKLVNKLPKGVETVFDTCGNLLILDKPITEWEEGHTVASWAFTTEWQERRKAQTACITFPNNQLNSYDE
jgi:hypothetical protein